MEPFFRKGSKEVQLNIFVKSSNYAHHPHAYNNLGTALMDIGEYEEASLILKAIELQPDYAEAYNNLGNVYKEMEEYNRQSPFMKKQSNSILSITKRITI